MPLSAWRLLVATCAASGVVLAAREYDVWWTALSQLANGAVALCFLGLAAYPLLTGRREPRSPWLQGALATTMTLVCLAYLPMQNGNATEVWSVVEHLVVPGLVVADYLLVTRNQAAVRWWHPLTWLLPPLAYLAWYVGGDLGVYAALDPSRPGAFTTQLAALTALVLAAGFAFYGAGRRRRELVVIPFSSSGSPRPRHAHHFVGVGRSRSTTTSLLRLVLHAPGPRLPSTNLRS